MDEVSDDLRCREPFLGTKQYPLEVVDEKEIAVDRESKPDAEDGNDSVKNGSSSFTYSDTGSTAAENVPVDVLVAAKVSPSTKFCEDEKQKLIERQISPLHSVIEIDNVDHSDTEMVSYVPVSSSQPIEANVFSSSSIYYVQNTEPVSFGENNLHEHSGDVSPVSHITSPVQFWKVNLSRRRETLLIQLPKLEY
ncbi:hypothetical protein POM88_011312 [Heracleum sosnowskyi]|uniref:Uncharacterized protein n=1 Tax=Heracleum sosnowskyi TaxID=360622 RepID=A0AAD8IV86_9APIA|nr:hypothetical protein POM88_011312 [Heracleum sosnowskyi]